LVKSENIANKKYIYRQNLDISEASVLSNIALSSMKFNMAN